MSGEGESHLAFFYHFLSLDSMSVRWAIREKRGDTIESEWDCTTQIDHLKSAVRKKLKENNKLSVESEGRRK